MISGYILILLAQAATVPPDKKPVREIAIVSTASVEILAGTTLSFDNWALPAAESPMAVQFREDEDGTIWIEFT